MSAQVVFVVLLIVLGCYIGAVGYTHWIAGLAYKENIGGYFSFADQASDAKTKSAYFNQYVDAVEKNELTKGCNSVWFCEQPNARMEDKYKVLKSLQLRLTEIAKLDEKETAYQLGMTQMTENEFCWFPQDSFFQKYMLDHGFWGLALTPIKPYNDCV